MAKIITAQKGKINKDQVKKALESNSNRYRPTNATATVIAELEDGAYFPATCTGEFMEVAVPGSKDELNLFALTKEKVRFRIDADIIDLLDANTEVILMKSSVNGGMAFATFMSVAGVTDNVTKQTA
jgi:hypothetical protein